MNQSSKDQIIVTLQYLEEEMHWLIRVLEKLKAQVKTEKPR